MYPLQVYVVMAQPETGALQTFILQQTDGKHIKSRMIYPTTSPSHIKSVKMFLGHGQGLPYVFALLSDKKQSTYEKLLALEKRKG